MSIFPFTDPVPAQRTGESLPLAKEYAWDFNIMDFKTRGGKMYLVEGKEAVRIWIWKLLNTPRYRFPIFSWDYGHELEDIIGKYTRGFTESEAERMVKEAVEVNLKGYVTELRDFSVKAEDDKLTIEFTAVTPYGEVRNIV